MGNNHPSSGLRSNGPFRRPAAFDFTRSELDERSKPSGLYQSCSWDLRTVRRMIGDGKLAARLKGKEERESGTEQECPICFLQYDEINMLKCCKANICTECYLQVQDSRQRNSPCPFCNKPNMSVMVAMRLGEDDVKKRDEEEQRVIEATIRARANSESQTSVNSANSNGNFGSRLNEEMKRTRARTVSDLGDSSGEKNLMPVMMTPDERRELEDQMRSQLSHPLMREMQRNADVESQRHLLEHAERRRDRLRNSRDQLERLIERARIREHGLDLLTGSHNNEYDDDDILPPSDEMGDRPSNSNRPTFDDFYLLEAALYLSAREDSIRRRGNRRGGRRNRNRNNDHTLLRALLGREDIRNLEPNGDGDDNDDNNDENNDENNRGSDNEQNDNDRNRLTASDILFAGLSEENQIEMAIRMSIQEAEERERQQQEQTNQEDENGTENAEEEANAVGSVAEEVSNEVSDSGAGENTSTQDEVTPGTDTRESTNVVEVSPPQDPPAP